MENKEHVLAMLAGRGVRKFWATSFTWRWLEFNRQEQHLAILCDLYLSSSGFSLRMPKDSVFKFLTWFQSKHKPWILIKPSEITRVLGKWCGNSTRVLFKWKWRNLYETMRFEKPRKAEPKNRKLFTSWRRPGYGWLCWYHFEKTRGFIFFRFKKSSLVGI